jgi:hypothetical protein
VRAEWESNSRTLQASAPKTQRGTEHTVRFHKVELHALGRVRFETVFKACKPSLRPMNREEILVQRASVKIFTLLYYANLKQ